MVVLEGSEQTTQDHTEFNPVTLPFTWIASDLDVCFQGGLFRGCDRCRDTRASNYGKSFIGK